MNSATSLHQSLAAGYGSSLPPSGSSRSRSYGGLFAFRGFAFALGNQHLHLVRTGLIYSFLVFVPRLCHWRLVGVDVAVVGRVVQPALLAVDFQHGGSAVAQLPLPLLDLLASGHVAVSLSTEADHVACDPQD